MPFVLSLQTRRAAHALRRQLVCGAQRRTLGRLRRQQSAEGVLGADESRRRIRCVRVCTVLEHYFISLISPAFYALFPSPILHSIYLIAFRPPHFTAHINLTLQHDVNTDHTTHVSNTENPHTQENTNRASRGNFTPRVRTKVCTTV